MIMKSRHEMGSDKECVQNVVESWKREKELGGRIILR
jgi:hypothetical protein